MSIRYSQTANCIQARHSLRLGIRNARPQSRPQRRSSAMCRQKARRNPALSRCRIAACAKDMNTSKEIEINRCYDSDEILLGPVRTFLSYKAYPIRNLGVPDSLICEAKAYFEEKCQRAGVVSDNFKSGACINSYMSLFMKRALGGTVPLNAGKSFHMECCEADTDRTTCKPPTSC